jgi:hypothetical protein
MVFYCLCVYCEEDEAPHRKTDGYYRDNNRAGQVSVALSERNRRNEPC